ncbi:MAG: lipopolysaccharide transport periplasmic protein LptA [Gammaproteobacteria bacterium]|nr:MAG: lipopolysaccharide transport periplasmic protein LptA [Gammaproteobacteria bacterium]
MPRLPSKLFLLSYLILSTSLSWALPSDREQPIEIEADHAQLDEQQGITQYKGRAILTQGTLRIEGDIITFYYDENKQLKKAVAQGKLATYQQIQKPGEKPVHAQALTMEYHAKAQKIYLLGKGHVWQNGDEFSGSRIVYDINRNIVNANSAPATTNNPAAKPERIHIIIQPPGSKKPVKTSKKTTAPKVTPTAEKSNSAEQDTSYPTATTTTYLNVRTGPGTQYNKLTTFIDHQLLIVLTEQKDWVQVRAEVADEVIIGWVARRYIVITN